MRVAIEIGDRDDLPEWRSSVHWSRNEVPFKCQSVLARHGVAPDEIRVTVAIPVTGHFQQRGTGEPPGEVGYCGEVSL
jgi:hypothetical protein